MKYLFLISLFTLSLCSCQTEEGVKKIAENLYEIKDARTISEADEAAIAKIEAKYYIQDFSSVPYVAFIENKPQVQAKGGFWSHRTKTDEKFQQSRMFYGVAPSNEDAEKIEQILYKYASISKEVKKVGDNIYDINKSGVISEADETAITIIESKYYSQDFSSAPYIAFIENKPQVQAKGGFWSHKIKTDEKFSHYRMFYGAPPNEEDLGKVQAILDKYALTAK